MFICGTGSFGNRDEDEAIFKPKQTKKSMSFCKVGKDNTNKNPFSNRGLDKFYALLAELDEKRQKIYTEMGSEEISFVHFVYSNDSEHVKPIVVKVKDVIKNSPNHIKNSITNKPSADNEKKKKMDETLRSQSMIVKSEIVSQSDGKVRQNKRYCQKCKEKFNLAINLRQPLYYFMMTIILILIFLAIFGRSFAIMCTSIVWYSTPVVIGGVSSSTSNDLNGARNMKRKKEYDRKLSENKIVNVSGNINNQGQGLSSPTSVINGPSTPDKASKKKFDRRSSW